MCTNIFAYLLVFEIILTPQFGDGDFTVNHAGSLVRRYKLLMQLNQMSLAVWIMFHHLK